MKKTIKSYSARLLAIVLVVALLIPSMALSTSASVASILGGSTVASQTVTTGLTYEKATFTKGGYGQTAYVMEFNPATSGLMPMAYQKSAGWGVTVANSVADAQANGYTVYGAINGEFFSPASGNWGTLTGRLISNGRIISDHELCNEYCIAIDKDGKLSLVKSQMSYHFYVEGKEMGSAAIARINKRYNGNWRYDPLCYFDSSCGTKTDTVADYPGVEVVFNKTNGTELIVEGVLQGEVVSVNTNTYGTSFGEDQFVLYAVNESAYASQLAALQPGQKVQIYAQELNDDAREAMTNAVTVSSATYPIVVNGVENTNNTPNASDIYLTRAQRTAIGVKADGTYVYFCSAGRGDSASNTKGVTLPELADIMIDLGCVTAINLDGGGSSTMNVNGTSAFTGDGRSVGSSILIVGRDGAATSTTAKQDLNDWIYNASTTEYASAEQQALVDAAIAQANAVYNDANSMTADFVREKMDLQMAMGVVTDVSPKTFISLDANDWSYDASVMQATNDANGALILNNTNGMYPAATLACDVNALSSEVLYYDITVAGQTSVNLYTTDGAEIKLNSFIAPNSIDAGSGDLIGNGQTFKGSVSIAEIKSAGLEISSVKIFAVGAKGDGSKVTVRELSIRDPYSGGDVNGDGNLDSTDARLVLRHVNGKATLSGSPLAAADANGDGNIDTQDIRYLLKKRVGLA